MAMSEPSICWAANCWTSPSVLLYPQKSSQPPVEVPPDG